MDDIFCVSLDRPQSEMNPDNRKPTLCSTWFPVFTFLPMQVASLYTLNSKYSIHSAKSSSKSRYWIILLPCWKILWGPPTNNKMELTFSVESPNWVDPWVIILPHFSLLFLFFITFPSHLLHLFLIMQHYPLVPFLSFVLTIDSGGWAVSKYLCVYFTFLLSMFHPQSYLFREGFLQVICLPVILCLLIFCVIITTMFNSYFFCLF